MKIDPFGMGVQNWGPEPPWTKRNWLHLKICSLIYRGYRRLVLAITYYTESRFDIGDAIIISDGHWVLYSTGEIGIVTRVLKADGYMAQFQNGEFWVPRYRILGHLEKPTTTDR